jgi:hypothetical protein
MPAETQLLLLLASAEPTGDPDLLWRSAERLGIAREAASPVRAAGLVEINHRVRFSNPLARSAVYRVATPPDRRRAHAALAAATDVRSDPDRRAWHRAQAAHGPHEEVAVELEQSAGRARDHEAGNPDAALALLGVAEEGSRRCAPTNLQPTTTSATGSGWAATSRPISGTTRRSTSSPAATSGWPGRWAR